MRVQPGFALLERNRAGERGDLYLFGDSIALVIFALAFEVAEHGIAESADSAQASTGKLLLRGEAQDGTDRLLAGFEHEDEDAIVFGVQPFASHR